VAAGRFGRPHGVRGEIRLDPKGGLPRGLDGYNRFYVDGKAGVEPVRVEAWRHHDELLLVTLSGVASREEAAELVNRTLYVERDELPPLEEGEYYHADVLGLDVVDEEGASLGRVADIRPWGDYDMLVVRSGSKEWMLPVIGEFVLSMDFDAGVVRVRIPEGLGP